MPYPKHTNVIDVDEPGSVAAPPDPPTMAASKAGSSRSRFPGPQAMRPTPLPKRPKGTLFVGMLLVALVAGPCYLVWDAFFRFQAYGVVTGRVIRISSAWGGMVRTLHVREGDNVRQGQVLATLGNVELEQRVARIGDDMRIAQATLESEMSQLQWESQSHGDRNQKALAEYFELWGTLRDEQAKLSEIELRRQRNETLRRQAVISSEAWDAITFAESGQREKVEKLTEAVEQLKKRAELDTVHGEDAQGQLKPQIVRIETLQAEMDRLRQLLKEGEIRAPVDGRVVKRHLFPGEAVQTAQTILEILEDGSLQVVLYVPQNQSDLYELGQDANVCIDPNSESLPCKVVRVGETLEAPPQSIASHYRKSEKLVPVYLQTPVADAGTALRLDSQAKLPYTWSQLIAQFRREPARASDGG